MGCCSPARLAGLSCSLYSGPVRLARPSRLSSVVCRLWSVSVCLSLAFPVGNVFFSLSLSLSLPLFVVCCCPSPSSFRLIGSLRVGGGLPLWPHPLGVVRVDTLGVLMNLDGIMVPNRTFRVVLFRAGFVN